MSEAYTNAIERAKQVVSKFSTADDVKTNGSVAGVKRPSADSEDSDSAGKRPLVNDEVAAEAAAKISQKLSSASTSQISQQDAKTVTAETTIPDRFVGLVIGKKGEQIIQLQKDSNCKVQISQEVGGPERLVTLTGTNQQVQHAKSMLTDIIDRAEKSNSTYQGNPGIYNSTPLQNGPTITIEILVPGTKAGLLIGKNGETIKQLQENNGVKMVIIQQSSAPTVDDKPLRISGEAGRVEKVKTMVYEIIARGKVVGGFGDNSEMTRYAVPTEKAGLVIGKGGETIKDICRVSGAHVEISKEPAPDQSIKIFHIRGNREEIEQAIRMISERASIPINAPATGASLSNTFGQYGYQADPWGTSTSSVMPAPGYNPYTGQPDYSAAWIEYYRRQGMHEYADMIQQQSRQQAGYGAAPAAQVYSTATTAQVYPATPAVHAYPVAPAAPNYPAVPSAVAAVPQVITQQVCVPQTQGYGPGSAQNQAQPQQNQCDYGQWQQWQAYQQQQAAYQQQSSIGRPMQSRAGVPSASGPSVPISGFICQQ